MTPTTNPGSQPDNKPQRIVLSFITAIFIIAGIVFAMGTYKACTPPVVIRDSIERALNDTLPMGTGKLNDSAAVQGAALDSGFYLPLGTVADTVKKEDSL